MVRASSSKKGNCSPPVDNYEWSSTTTEYPEIEAQMPTWSVEFNRRPSKYHGRGPARWWDRRKKEIETADKGIFRDTSILARLTEHPEPLSCGDVDYKDSDSESEGPLPNPVRKLSKKAWKHMFATVNNGTVRVYYAEQKKHPHLLLCFEDPDQDETYYAVNFVYNANNDNCWWVLAAGSKGVIRVLDINNKAYVKSLMGHGEAVNDMSVHPRDPALIVTASKDESLRMWNLRLGTSIAVFAGLKGHRGEVLSVDFDRYGNRFASCGIDNSVRIWEVTNDEQIVCNILESHYAAEHDYRNFMYTAKNGERKVMDVPISQFPCFVTRKVHKHYVDCVKWVGDNTLLSKSVHNRIYLWELGNDREALAVPAQDYTLLEEYVVDNCNVWFVKFGIDREHRTIACGNELGHVYLYRLDRLPPQKTILMPGERHSDELNSNAYVRKCAFSDDGSMVVAVDDFSNIFQFDRTDESIPVEEEFEFNE